MVSCSELLKYGMLDMLDLLSTDPGHPMLLVLESLEYVTVLRVLILEKPIVFDAFELHRIDRKLMEDVREMSKTYPLI